MRRLGRLARCAALLPALLLWHGPAAGSADDEYLAQLIARSRQLQLARRPEWLKLVHYQPNVLAPGVHGLVESARFYNAPAGRSDPQAELEATLASFYSDAVETDSQQNPQCLFVARFAWLNEQLGFDPDRLPRRPCPRYRAWHAALDPAGITLVFASAYLNSPSSMFGHTFLRVDSNDQDERTRLLAYSINFAASTRETNGIAFAVKGLFGGYPGAFSILPYYVKVREYSDLENRDIWEYRLDLSADEIDRVLMHAWELGSVHFRYFFFDDNCSYQLLGLLQVARPGLDLTGEFHVWAIPTDTVRAVTGQPGLLRSVAYRPSNATVIRQRLRPMSEPERRLVRGLSLRAVAPDDPALAALRDDRAAAVLEASQDYVGYRRTLDKGDVAEPAALEHELVAARSRLQAPAQTPAIAVPDVPPDQSHASSRVLLGAGRWDARSFQELGARGAYHDIMDPEGGYVRGAQIDFLDLGIRRYQSGVTRVERFTPLSLLSLAPRDDFFQPISWRIDAGWQRVRLEDGAQPLMFALGGGAGASWSALHDSILGYALLDGAARLNSSAGGGSAFGAGGRAGLLLDATARWRLHAYARTLSYFLGQRDAPWTLGLEQRLALGSDVAVRVDAARDHGFRQSYGNASVSLQLYF